jgi:hypothetical protein
MQEFNSKSSCLKAMDILKEQLKDGKTFKIDCVEK